MITKLKTSPFYLVYAHTGLDVTIRNTGKKNNITSMLHPEYVAHVGDWGKFRLTMIGGKRFVNKYLERFSKREDTNDFNTRKEITYCPAHAKAALLDIKNSIYERMSDIKRVGGSDSYQTAITGAEGGVDLTGQSMTGFIGCDVLPELLSMGAVGVYVDKPPVPENASLAENSRPYLYLYPVEAIRSWCLDSENRVTSLLLEDNNFEKDEETGLIIGEVQEFRLLQLLEGGGVLVRFFNAHGVELLERVQLLELEEIPFVHMFLSQSLLTDVADIQIALLNMASSDVNYSLKSNYPFYTEQYDPLTEFLDLRDAPGTGIEDESQVSGAVDRNAGTEADAKKSNRKEIRAGSSQGRRYAKGIERPAFIAPSAEPLRASMEKQDELKKEIRQLINLSIRNLEPVRASAESKGADDGGLQAGLACIGLELEHGEREIARIWDLYEGNKTPATIHYPTKYDLKTEAERRAEADELTKIRATVPSMTAQRELSKEVVEILLGHKTDNATLIKMQDEIEKATVLEINPEVLRSDHEAGFVSTETASRARLYPEGEVEQAKEDHVERLARIAIAQSDASNRGDNDGSADPNAGKLVKEGERNTDDKETTEDPTRGEGKNNAD
jgi:hypothetical protein